MKSDALTLSPESTKKYLNGCKPGDRKTISVEIVVGEKGKDGLSASVENVHYEDHEYEDHEAPKGKPDVGKSKRPVAVMAILSKK